MNRDVKVGDKIAVTRVNYEDLERVHFTEVMGVYGDLFGGISINPDINGEDTLYIRKGSGDEWRILTEDHVQHEEETLQHRQAHAYYDDEALSPSYSDAVKSGMTFADYTGVNITEESLDFEPKEEEVLRGITAESLNFEEAPKSDAVNHPSHYNYGDIEVIDFIEQVTQQYEDGFDAYIVGNALKYLARSPHKNGLEDVKKAVWYLERLIKRNEDE